MPFLSPEVQFRAVLRLILANSPVTLECNLPLSAASIDYLRQQSCVSYEAMLGRLVNLKVITKKEREGFLPYAIEDALPNAVTSPSLPERYKALAAEAYRRARIPIGKLADVLRIDLYEARKLVKQLGIQQSPA